MKKIAIAVSLLVAGMLWTAGPQVQASPGGGGCELVGTASFTPGLTATTAGNFKYSFSGKLTPCQSDPSQTKPPSSGVVSAGKVLAISGVKYQEPIPTGNGSCAQGTTKGISLITWNDKTQTVVSYTTQSVTGGVFLGGPPSSSGAFATVLPSVKLKQVGGTATYTFKTTRYVGAGGVGALTFSPNPNPTACNAAGGVKSAGITGFVGLGSSS